MKKEVIAYESPKSFISEALRTLRTNIQFMNTSQQIKTLLVTSTNPNEGKSWVASNLAVTFAQAGKKVVLIDADMRKGRQYAIFEVSPTPGLSNYLGQVQFAENQKISENIFDYIQKTEMENLSIISAGNIPPNPSELLLTTKMEELLINLKAEFDIIIVDGTPCELVTDAVILARIVDSTILVAEQGNTKKNSLERVVKNIQNVGGKIAGIVINKIKLPNRTYEADYYYGEKDKFLDEKKSKFHKRKDKRTLEINENSNKQEIEQVKIKKIEEEKSEDIENNDKKRSEKKAKKMQNKSDFDELSKAQEIMEHINEYVEKK